MTDAQLLRQAKEALGQLQRDYLLALQALIAERGAHDLNPACNKTVVATKTVIAAIEERLLVE